MKLRVLVTNLNNLKEININLPLDDYRPPHTQINQQQGISNKITKTQNNINL